MHHQRLGSGLGDGRAKESAESRVGHLALDGRSRRVVGIKLCGLARACAARRVRLVCLRIRSRPRCSAPVRPGGAGTDPLHLRGGCGSDRSRLCRHHGRPCERRCARCQGGHRLPCHPEGGAHSIQRLARGWADCDPDPRLVGRGAPRCAHRAERPRRYHGRLRRDMLASGFGTVLGFGCRRSRADTGSRHGLTAHGERAAFAGGGARRGGRGPAASVGGRADASGGDGARGRRALRGGTTNLGGAGCEDEGVQEKLPRQ
mmetsp:Transcript_13974/g.49181  ORF Transcript_13974/g.49181 Transcript_13974/m.49181 type:complete len:260 (-) Transcript_13974:642-1421(-)